MTEKELARSELPTRHAIERGFDRAAESSKHVVDEFETAMEALWETSMGRGYPPFMQNLARANIEMVGFFGRRARAMMEFPAQLVRCKSPEGVLEEQLRFFKDAMEDYEGASARVVQALRSGAEETLRKAGGSSHKSTRMHASSNAASVKKQTPKRSSRRKSATGKRQGADT